MSGEVITVYDLDQARKIIYEEMQQDREKINAIGKRRREQKVRRIKFVIGLFATLIVPPLTIVAHWIAFGY